MLGIGDQVSEIAVLGNDYRDVDALHQRLGAAAGDAAEVLPWSELAPHLSGMLGVMDGFVLVWIVIVFLALSFGLVNTLVMAVFERVREIGLMMALGVKPGVIRAQVLAEAVMLLGVGTLIGDGLAWASIQPLRDGIDLSGVSEGMDLLGVGAVLTPVLRGRRRGAGDRRGPHPRSGRQPVAGDTRIALSPGRSHLEGLNPCPPCAAARCARSIDRATPMSSASTA